MKKILIAIPFAILLGACAPKTYNSMIWQAQPPHIDGKADEWGNPLRYYDKNSKLFYEIKNDRENLYIAFKANEEDIIMRAKQRGIKIAIDTANGKDDYPISITFPFHKRPMDGHGNMRPDSLRRPNNIAENGTGNMQQHPDSTSRPKGMPPMMKMTSSLKLTGLGSQEADTVPAKGNQYGIEAALLNDPKAFFCELKIPFASLYKRAMAVTDTTKALFFEVTLEASQMGDMQMPKGNRPDSNGDGHGGPPSGGGGFGGGDMPSGPPPDGGGGGPGGGGPGGMGGGMPGGQGMSQNNQTPSIFRFELRPRFQ